MRALPPALLSALLVLSGACDRPRGTRAPAEDLLAAGWIDAEPIGAPTLDDPARLDALEQAGARGRLLRLDRLIDLYDGARFAQDKPARDSLWLALGGYATTRGIDASREVVLRLLDEAYALEDLAAAQPGSLDEDEQRFVVDAIMLLSADMFLPDGAEALISQTLAYRVLAETGHPRIADNARWRLYDHVRGVLDGAIGVGPELRPDIAVHALYVEREDISAWLEDLAPHAQPPLPDAARLWALLDAQREALAELPRWRPVVAARAEAEAALRETVVDALPRPRDPSWALAKLPRGTGQRESLAPVMLLSGGERIVEPSSDAPQQAGASELDDETRAAIEAALIRDGRGIMLLAADPQTPAPEFATALRALIEARVTTVELAVLEPRIEAEGAVIVALPLYLITPEELGPGARALREARITVHLSGRGPRFAVDGRWLSAAPQLPSDVQKLAAELRRAYPRERVIGLTLAADVQPGQLVDLLAGLTGGIDPLFFAAGLLVGAPTPAGVPTGDPTLDATVAARLALVDASPTIAVKDGAALSEDDRARIEQAAASLRECVPELETKLPKGLAIELEFGEGKLVELRATGKRAPAAAIERFEGCARERLLGFRLREAEQPLVVGLSVGPQ